MNLKPGLVKTGQKLKAEFYLLAGTRHSTRFQATTTTMWSGSSNIAQPAVIGWTETTVDHTLKETTAHHCEKHE